MKLCKNCKFGKWYSCYRETKFNVHTDQIEGILDRRTNAGGICKYYERKWWKFWIPKSCQAKHSQL